MTLKMQERVCQSMYRKFMKIRPPPLLHTTVQREFSLVQIFEEKVADFSQEIFIFADAGVIGDPAPPRIWHPQVKSPRDFGTPSVFLVSPNKQGIWIPMQNSLENLESPCKIPQRIWHPHEKFPREFGISIQESLLLWHPYVRIQSLETFITVPLFAFWWKLLHLGWYQSPHVSHSTISSYISGI